MILIHTADWHIGQNFYGYDRYGEHRHFLDWLENTLVEKRADVLLVTGDVFDGPNPPAKAQQLYYAFLRRIADRMPGLQVIVTAGNHDSAARLEAPNPLLEALHVTVVGSVHYGEADGMTDNAGNASNADNAGSPGITDTAAALEGAARRLLIPLCGASGEVEACCVAVPYLRQGDYPPAPTYDEGVRQLYAALAGAARRQFGGKPLIMTGHLHVLGAAVSERDRSERVVIGGLDCVSDAIFPPDIAYGALGHLHRAQRVAGRDHVRYAGAPVPMSFAEKRNVQSVSCIEIKDGHTAISLLPYEPKVALLSVPDRPGDLDEILACLAELPQGEVTEDAPYLEIKVRMTGPDPGMRYKIEQALRGKCVRLTAILPFYPERREADGQAGSNGIATGQTAVRELSQIPPLDIARDVYQKKYGGEMPVDLQTLLSTVIKEVEA